METLERPPIIIGGMHRSGTSFVASLLREAGVDVGSRLMPAGRGNARGHFENLDFVEFHMRKLVEHGYDDAGWAAVPVLALDDGARAEAQALIEGNRSRSPWGWKDPRTVLFLDFWSEIVPTARHIFIYREPTEVIDSIFRRGDSTPATAPEVAAEAWLRYNESILHFAREHRAQCIIANTRAIADSPRAFLKLVCDRFGVDIDVDSRSPFEVSLLQHIPANSMQNVLLRHLYPDIGQLFHALDQEADLPSLERFTAYSDTERRNVFLSAWRDASAQPVVVPDTIPPLPEEEDFWSTDLLESMHNLQDELTLHKSVLTSFAASIESILAEDKGDAQQS